MDRDDVDGSRRPKLTRSMSYFHNVQNSLLFQTRRLTAYLTSDDKNSTKALQQAAYTTISTFFLILCLAVAVCIYFILEPFLRPLLWALLCGTLLHPLKYTITQRFKQRLDLMTYYEVPLFIGILISPVVYLNELSAFLEMQFLIYWKMVTGLSMLCVVLYSTVPYHIIFTGWVTWCAGVFNSLIHRVDPWLSYVTPLQIFTIAIGCVVVNYLGPTKTRLIQVMSLLGWSLLVVLCVSTLFGSVRMYVLICVGCVVTALWVSELYQCRVSISSNTVGIVIDAERSESPKSKSESGDEVNDAFSKDIADSNVPLSSTPNKRTDTSTLRPVEVLSTDHTLVQSGMIPGCNAEFRHMDSVECKRVSVGSTSITTRHDSALLDNSRAIYDDHGVDDIGSRDQRESHDQRESLDQRGSHDDTDFGMQVDKKLRKNSFRTPNKRQLISQIFFILILICVVTLFYHNPRLALSFLSPVGCMVLLRRIVYINFVNTQLKWVWLRWRSSSLHNIIFPPLVCHVYSAYTKLDKKIVDMLRKYSDSLISAVIVVGLVLASVAFSILLLLQLRSDIAHYSSVSAQVWSTVRTNYPQLDKWVSSDANDSLNLEQAFDHMASRGYQYGRHWLKSQIKSFVDVGVNDTAVDELVELLDNLYSSYVLQNNTAQLTAAIPSNLFNNDSQLMENARGFFMKNFQSIMKMTSSVWKLMSTQLNFAVSMATAIISVLLSSGTVVLNFIVSVIVFVTTLYYLLNSSDDQYLPVRWISNLLPTGDDPDAGGTAFTMAIRSVFAASLKTAAFYGLYTWLIHAIFGMQTAILAAVLAAVAGAIPFIGTYWASLPAVLELWLIQDQLLLAVTFLSLHILPTMFVDYLIYEDLESGHPYLTGLAIVGGFYYSGLEGAILGPILLCCMLFFQHLYGAVMATS